MTSTHTRHGTLLLGIALMLYALSGLAAVRFSTRREWEAVCGPVVGAVTGIVTAATGVFVLPAVPYLQSIGLEKEELVQALGLSFTVSTLALAVNVWMAGALNVSLAGTTLAAVTLASVGMGLGQTLRRHLAPDTFRRWFFFGLLMLALYLIARSMA